MCEEWYNSYSAFKIWCIQNGYKDGLTIDRINNDKGYEPSNCRLVTPMENCNNRRNTFMVNYNGNEKPFTELLRELGLLKHQYAIRTRMKRGWTAQDAINTPIRKGNYHNTGYKYKHT